MMEITKLYNEFARLWKIFNSEDHSSDTVIALRRVAMQLSDILSKFAKDV